MGKEEWKEGVKEKEKEGSAERGFTDAQIWDEVT